MLVQDIIKSQMRWLTLESIAVFLNLEFIFVSIGEKKWLDSFKEMSLAIERVLVFTRW